MTAIVDRNEDESLLEKKNAIKSEENSWIEYGMEQAQILKKTLEETMDSVTERARNRFFEIRSTSSAHFLQTIENLETLKTEYNTYEDLFFGKIKEGLGIVTSYPSTTVGVVTGLGIVALKRPRRFLLHRIMRLLVSEESLLTRADAKVKELRQTIDLLKNESKKLEERASLAEEEMKRGRMKLKQAGHQIQGVISSIYKIERQARGLKDIVEELPRRECSRFRTQISSLTSEAKRERSALSKEVTKIINYGISI